MFRQEPHSDNAVLQMQNVLIINVFQHAQVEPYNVVLSNVTIQRSTYVRIHLHPCYVLGHTQIDVQVHVTAPLNIHASMEHYNPFQQHQVVLLVTLSVVHVAIVQLHMYVLILQTTSCVRLHFQILVVPPVIVLPNIHAKTDNFNQSVVRLYLCILRLLNVGSWLLTYLGSFQSILHP